MTRDAAREQDKSRRETRALACADRGAGGAAPGARTDTFTRVLRAATRRRTCDRGAPMTHAHGSKRGGQLARAAVERSARHAEERHTRLEIGDTAAMQPAGARSRNRALRSSLAATPNETITSHLAGKNDPPRDFFFRIPKSGVLSNLRAGRAPIFGLSPLRAVSGL